MFNKIPTFFKIFIISAVLTFILLMLVQKFPYFDNQIRDKGAMFAIILILTSAFYGAIKDGRVKGFLVHIFGWIGIILIIITLYSFKEDFNFIGSRVISSIFPSYGINYKPGEILISRSIDGHFYVLVTINNIPIKFMIDTGASDIALTQQDAKKLNLDPAKLKYTKIYSTANGLSAAAPVTLQNFQIGKKSFNNIQASVSSGDNDISLLGMSVISRFKSFRIDGDKLILQY